MCEPKDLDAQMAAAEEGSGKSVANGAAAIGDTDPSSGLTDAQVEQARAKFGLNEIPAEITPLYKLFLRQFVGFLPLLIELAALVSLIVQDWADFGIIFSILMINAMLGFREEYHAKKCLDELANSIESEITVLRNGGQAVVIPTTQLVPGDICFLVGGCFVPADVKWLRGDTMSLDTAALTGEPIPRKYPSQEYGSIMLSGTTVVAGECYGQVMLTGTDTEIGQAQADVLKDKSVRVVSVFQQKIMYVVQTLISFSLLVVLAVLLVDGLVYNGFSTNPRDTILTALGILISAIPIALPLVLQVNLALGAAFLAKKHHAIVTSIPALQDIASMSILCSDKTGTLTTAKMSIIQEQIYAADGFSKDDVAMFSYLCANSDKKDDPIDKAIIVSFDTNEGANKRLEMTGFKQDSLIGFNPEVKRVVAFCTGSDGKVITIAKGLPAKIINTEAGGKDSHELQWKVDKADDAEFIRQVTDTDTSLSSAGYKTIGIAVAEGDARTEANPVWKFVGLMPMLDPPREDTANTIESLHRANISVKMITGDHVNVGKETARLIGLGTDIQPGERMRNCADPTEKKTMIWEADGFAAVLPSDKREVVLILRNEYGIVTGMTGDGVNDAAALSAAQVGIAVQGATDAAKNAADLILTEPGLSPIYGAVIESRRIFARIKSYVVYRIAASIILVLTLSIIIFASGCAVDSLLVIILALLNDISMIPVAYDNADATAKPQLPNAYKLVLMSLFYGVSQSILGLVFIFVLNATQGLKNDITLNRECSSETRGFIWLYLVLVTEFMIFSARAPAHFYDSSPSLILAASVLLTCVVGTLISVYGSDLSWLNVLWIWIYNLVVFVVVDFVKVPYKTYIGDGSGEIIKSDELFEVDPSKTDTMKGIEKEMRNEVHLESQLSPADFEHTVELVEHGTGFVGSVTASFLDLGGAGITDGFINKRRRTREISNASSAFGSIHSDE